MTTGFRCPEQKELMTETYSLQQLDKINIVYARGERRDPRVRVWHHDDHEYSPLIGLKCLI